MAGDVISLEDDGQPGEPLLQPVMRKGHRLTAPAMTDIRNHAANNLAQLPEPLHRLDESYAYRVEIAPALQALARQVDLGKAQVPANA